MTWQTAARASKAAKPAGKASNARPQPGASRTVIALHLDDIDPDHLEELAALVRERQEERTAQLAGLMWEQPALGYYRRVAGRPAGALVRLPPPEVAYTRQELEALIGRDDGSSEWLYLKYNAEHPTQMREIP